MFTIREASNRTGVPAASLRAWERRYHVVTPHRSEGGYRLYDERAIATIAAMRRLVDQGWSPASAAAELTGQEGMPSPVPRDGEPDAVESSPRSPHPEAELLTAELVAAAARVDAGGIESVLDRGFALGSFETVTEGWLMPALRALGDAWAEGRVDVAGEHAASHAVMRRLSQAFVAAASVASGPRLVVGLPPGSHHELGALAFATAARRRGLAVVYVGADLPLHSWVRAVRAFPTRAAVVAVPTEDNRAAAVQTVRALLDAGEGMVVAAGGPHSADLAPGVLSLPPSFAEAARVIERSRA